LLRHDPGTPGRDGPARRSGHAARSSRRGIARNRRPVAPAGWASVLVALGLAFGSLFGPGSGSPVAAACGSFQAIVDAAPSGGTITIPPCTYHESVTVRKPITINATGVVIDGDNVRTLGIAVLANDVTINGLTVVRVNSDTHVGAVWSTGVSRLTFRGGVARDSATVCISLNGGTGHRVLDSEFSGCGKEGYFMNGVSDTLFSGNRIHDNNLAHAFNPGDEAGGGKTMASQRVAFDRNEVNHNGGPGIWFDSGVLDASVTNNRVHDNERAGIFFEISDGATISGNAVWNNGFGFVAWGYGAGITVSSSDRADVHDNTVAWNARGISVISQARGPQPHSGNLVHDNTIIATGGEFVTGFYDDHGGSLFDSSNGNSGYRNRYWVGAPEPSTDRFGWTGPHARLAEFAATPGEEGSTYLTAAERDGALASAGIPGADGTPPPAPPAGPATAPSTSTAASAPPVPRLSFGSGQMRSNGSLPGRVTWAATIGARAYQLQVQRDGGPWTTAALASATSRSTSLLLAGGSGYRARVRVQVANGGWSPWAYSAAASAYRFQETSGGMTWAGSWTRTTSVGASGRYVRFRAAAGSTATFRFRGSAVAWIAPRGITRGAAAVYVDGTYRSTVSLYRSSSLARSIVFVASFPSVGTHTLMVKVVGTSGHRRVDVDAFAVLR
jgi:parallel beta-helix repeat protein